jgi:hypothetical protein
MASPRPRLLALCLPLLWLGCPGELDLSGIEDRSSWASGEGGTESTGGGSPVCAAWADGDTVALYTFDGDYGSPGTVTDAAAQLDGEIVGDGIKHVEGREGCGRALVFSGEGGHVLIPAAAELESLEQGTIDFWLRIDGKGEQGVLSRDAANQREPGHLTILVTAERRIRVRLQDSSDNGGAEHEMISERVERNEWHHVAVCFGPPELALYLDGEQQDAEGTSIGIAGNNNPLVLGGASWGSPEGKAEPVVLPLHGALDSVRISAVRRGL